MIHRSSTFVAALAVASFALPAFGQSQPKVDLGPTLSKEALHAQMLDVAERIDTLKATPGAEREVANLRAWYDAVRALLGGDDPAQVHSGGPVIGQQPSGPLALSAPSCGAALSTVNYPGVGGAITPPTTPPPFLGDSFTCVVSGAGPYLWDLNLNTIIQHTDSSDLDIRLTSPAGTVVTITTDNGSVNDNCFNGTLWDDNVNAPCTDFTYANNVTATPLSPEGRLAAFRGEDPNGTWTLSIVDDLATDTGSVAGWSLDVTTLAAAPTETTASVTESPAAAIPDASNLIRSLIFSSPDTYVSKVTLYLELPHTDCSDLDITLTSPAGTTVKVTTDNGSSNDNCFNGTLFDADVLDPVTDHVYTNNVVVAQLSPEGAFDNFLGQNPNGAWILVVTDDLATDIGTLARWDLNITTTSAPSPSGPANFAGSTGPITDNPGTPPPTINPTTFTLTVSGAGTFLWDVDLSTAIAITSSADVDMTLTSPAGTVVTITTDNAGASDDCFNGTLWDDNANDPVTDHVFTNAVVAPLLSPEGRLDAFRGEDPNGTWTLTITDDALADNGTLNTWSLDLSTLASAPAEVTTTFSSLPGITIPTTSALPPFTDSIAVSGLGTNVTEVEVYLEITHTYSSDLDITLTSPAGTIVTLTTDNGAGNNDNYNGTLFDADAPSTVTDVVYVNAVVVPLVSPEGSFGNFQGQDPNGSWTMTVVDDLGVDGGVWARWDLTIRTCSPVPFNGFCFGDNLDPLVTTDCPCANFGAVGRGCASSFNANGAQMTATGTPALDDVTLNVDGVNASGNVIFMRGDATNGAGVVFGDGVRCVDGVLRRRTKAIYSPNVSSFPLPTDTVLLSNGWGVGNDTPPGSGVTAYYMAYYRNAAALHCPPETFNGTNGFVITW